MWTVLYVIAGTKEEFNDFVLKNVESDRYRDTNFCWVGHGDVFKGQVNPNGICIGTWKDRSDILDVLQCMLATCKDQSKFDRALELGIMVTKHRQSKMVESSEVMRLDSSGNLGIGVTPAPRSIAETSIILGSPNDA